MSEHEKHRRRWLFIPRMIVVAIVIALTLTAGQWLANIFFRFTGCPSDFWAYIISGLIGFFVLAIISRIAVGAVRKSKHANGMKRMVNETLEAVNRISQGDFSVVLKVGEHDPFTELNKSINKMARELGSMETLRQDFISNASHEIQSPLTSIGGFAALLQNDELSPEQRRHYAAVIEAESRRLSGMSENLLKLSALESQDNPLSFSEFRIDKQIESAALTMEPQWAAKNISMEAELPKTLFYGDEGLLSQVWVNLLHNAIKFTHEGGQIHIALTQEPDFTCVKISDTGIGIAPENQMHIFERFYKADKARDRSQGGNGLGLSLVKKIAELHGGSVTVESELGNGSVFSVVLPYK